MFSRWIRFWRFSLVVGRRIFLDWRFRLEERLEYRFEELSDFWLLRWEKFAGSIPVS
jgi:hypothetical protein